MKRIFRTGFVTRSLVCLLLALGCVSLSRVYALPAPMDYDGDGKTDFVTVRNVGDQITWTIVLSGGPPLSHGPTKPVIQLLSATNGVFQMTFNSQATTNYAVQFKSSLTNTSWTTVSNIVGTGGTVTNKTAIGTNRNGYFRVLVQ